MTNWVDEARAMLDSNDPEGHVYDEIVSALAIGLKEQVRRSDATMRRVGSGRLEPPGNEDLRPHSQRAASIVAVLHDGRWACVEIDLELLEAAVPEALGVAVQRATGYAHAERPPSSVG